jgi:predicted porin
MDRQIALPTMLVLGLCCGAASGQASITAYGRVVAGLDYRTHASNDGTTSSSRLGAASNQWLTSLFGFVGDEDLGGGLQALFKLESGFESTNGVTNGAALFNRFAYVGLGSVTAGTLKVGKFGSISNDVWCIDPMGQQWLGSASLVRGRNWLDANNAVQYATPDMDGYSAIFQYTFGERAASASSQDKGGVSLAYVQPAFELRLIYDLIHDEAGRYSDIYNASEEWTLGATWTIDKAKWYAAYHTLSARHAPLQAPSKVHHSWVGVNYQASDALQLVGALYHVTSNKRSGAAKLYAVGANYSLSKRTVLYATVGHVRNGGSATFSARYWEPHVAGQDQASSYFGISHAF